MKVKAYSEHPTVKFSYPSWFDDDCVVCGEAFYEGDLIGRMHSGDHCCRECIQ